MTGLQEPRAAEAARIVEAVAAQRDLVARHLHDEAVQSVSVAALRVELVRAAVGPGVEEVEELREVLRTATLQIRAVMDSLRRPSVGNGELVRSLRERFASMGDVRVIDDLVRDVPEPVALVLHWTAEECVRCVLQAHADAAVSVGLHSPAGGFALEVAAPLAGGACDLDEPPEGAARLLAMLGGSITADSASPGAARMRAKVPWGTELGP